ncbi:MAG: radical SAM protein [Marinilabiliaceae bacterium]|nr:radical SAM protein [Marinilabiliaceae bacterium]
MNTQKYAINHNYMIRNDQNRAFISYRYHLLHVKPSHFDAETDFFSFIHPEQAKILALFDGKRDLLEIINIVASRLNTTEERAESLISNLIENKNMLNTVFQGNIFTFPKNLIVPLKDNAPVYTYSQKQFNCLTTDFKSLRLYRFPLDVTFMVNTVCNVDCIYCYADCRKKFDCQIPQERLEKLISDCKENKVRIFDLMGGEVLMYKNWQWLLKTMIKYGFTPFLSTKIPINNQTIQEIKSLGIKKLQISLDSFEGNVLEKNLNITNGNRYIEKMRKTLNNIEKTGLELNIHAVITQYNKEVSHINKYLEELSKIKCVNNVQISIVGGSMYKSGYENHKLSSKEIEQIEQYINTVQKNFSFKINLSYGMNKNNYLGNKEFKTYSYNKRGLCSGNVRQVFILPDGNVTICEELMFNKNFILGNIIDEDLQSIWKKNRLKHLEEKNAYHNSVCGKCKDFDNCKSPQSRGVCWKEILHAYGEEKWNYPDPKCPHAPRKMKKFYIN